MAVREQPLIAVHTLLALRSLLNSQPLLVGRHSTISEVSSTQGGRVESNKTTDVSVRRRKKARTARGNSAALSRTDGPDASGGSHRSKRRGGEKQ
jgi:hypothetical protein